ncbi:MAG: phosphoribosylanthranilate isomerase [Gemmatimonadota bacterium]|nr:phosphoribosylanthranilate isomerase [Gemmatimonadota bacterium]
MRREADTAGPRVKICGVTRREDALVAEELGADFVGFILSSGFGRSVPEAEIPDLVRGLAPSRVAVLVDERPGRAVALAEGAEAAVVQLHGEEPPDVARAIREAGSWTVWKAVRARAVEDVARAVLDYGDWVDGLLIEGWKAGVTGGGGARLALDPERVRASIPAHLTFVLAGGLKPDSVGRAITRFRPDVVDVSSGVEGEPGRKDREKVRRFIAETRLHSGMRSS